MPSFRRALFLLIKFRFNNCKKMKENEPLIAIIGRPNVGKSTLFNRLLRSKKSIVHHEEGITRDRIYGSIDWTGHRMRFIDTGGYLPVNDEPFSAVVRNQAELAVKEADLVLLLVDGRVDPTATDQILAQVVRKSGKPYVLVINKCDHQKVKDRAYVYSELGLDDLFPISALHGGNTGDLLDHIVNRMGLIKTVGEKSEDSSLRLAIVGMPNVGKSSLANALLQREQTIVTPIAGTTRDSIDTSLMWYGKHITLVDTAGLRKKAKVTESIEFYSNVRTRRSIQTASVVIVMIDAEKGFGHQDKSIVEMVINEGKGLVLVVNKWDLIEKDSNSALNFQNEIKGRFKLLTHFPFIFISAKTRQRVSKVLDIVWNVNTARNQYFGTKSLNSWLDRVTKVHPPPASEGRVVKLKFINQVASQPPVFMIFCNYPKKVPVSYRRYLENEMRKEYPLSGTPVKISIRKK
jgi:GTP-binding protein